MNGADLVELVRRRYTVLRAIADAPRTRHQLVDALPDAKSTVYKGVTQLQAAGLITDGSGDLAPTLFGSVALARYESLLETAAHQELLATLPADAVHPDVVRGARVVRPDESDAERHVEALWDLLETAESARAVAPVVSPGYAARLAELLEAGLTAEVVLPSAVVETVRTSQSGPFAAVAERATLYETTVDVPFGVLLTDGPDPQVAIEFRDGPVLTGIVTNDTPAAREWAKTAFEVIRDGAAPLELGDGAGSNADDSTT
jgi:predicted transcriptional regulator